MKLRDRVSEEIEAEKIVELQTEAEEIFTKNKYFNKGIETEGNIWNLKYTGSSME